jgi:glycosyltransferase involved in cell wall biosynthesis
VFETECAMLEKAGYNVIRYVKHNDEVERLSKLSLFCKTIWNREAYNDITELIKKHKPLVLHCHNTFPLISPSVYWAAAKQGVPVVQTLHNYRLLCINPYLYRGRKICEDCIGRSPLRGLFHRCYRNSITASFTVSLMLMFHRLAGTYRNKITRYIVLTEFARKKFLEAGVCESAKISVKPNAVMLEESPEGAGKQEQKPESDAAPPTVLYVGRLSPEKGADLLVEAWKLGIEKFPAGARLLVFGDGPERTALEEAAEGIVSIKFFGRVSQKEVRESMLSASLLVLPSRCYEMFAVAPIEAMALRLPTLASDSAACGMNITNGETGFVFESGSPRALSDKLCVILSDDRLLKKVGENAYNAFLSGGCSEERNLSKLLENYKSTDSSFT